MKKFEIIRSLFEIVIAHGYNDDKQDAISEYTKDKLTNTVYVKKHDIKLPNIDSIAITAMNNDFSDACDSDLRIAFNDGNIGKRVILYANEIETPVLFSILEYFTNLYKNEKDLQAYNDVVNQLDYMERNHISLNLPANPLKYILMRFKTLVIDKN